MRRHLKLSTQILLLQVVIVIVALGVGVTATVATSGEQLEEQYGQRALAVAEAVATLPSVREAFDDPHPPHTLQPLAEAIREASGLTFVVIADDEGVRYSHPSPERIGERVSTDPGPALRGEDWIGVEHGTLGRSVRAKVPIFGEDGQVMGIVSVGILMEEVAAQWRRQVPAIALSTLAALSLGVIGSLLLARRLKRQTFGLEPREIAALLEQREAMLKGIKEGTIGVDVDGRFTFINDEAARLLGLTHVPPGTPVEDAVEEGRLLDLLTGQSRGHDEMLVVDEHVLVANRMPVVVRGERIGAVVTLRDRTELEDMGRELTSVRGMTDALRAQAHEFSNRLHTIAGLIELDRADEALRFISDTTMIHQALAESLINRLGSPALVALLLAKAASASEHGIELSVAEGSSHDEVADTQTLVTVLGNLIDNAIEAITAAGQANGRIDVAVRSSDGGVNVRVADNGPGVPPAAAQRIFADGFTTKSDGKSVTRGLGLALVRQAVARRGGTIEVSNDGGAVFTVFLPAPKPAAVTR